MSFGTAQRGTQHAMGATDGVFVPRYRITSPLVIAKGLDGLNRHCYQGDVLGYLNDEQREHFLRLGLVERIGADAQGTITAAADAPAERIDLDDTADTDTGPADTGAVDECIGVLDRLQVPTTAGAPAARTALRGNGFRFGNAVVAAAVKRRKLSGTATDDDDEEFESVVM